VSGVLQLRVRVLEAWNDIVLDVPGATLIGDIKRRALDAAHVTADPAGFVVKFRGAALRDEARSVADAGVPDDAALIVLRRHRVPAR
jgi:hypothetical protein